MALYLLKKIAYGALVLWGVVTIVFVIFSMGGDPVENLVSENAPQEVKDNIRRKLNLDLPFSQRYALYLNDLSPVSIHNENFETSRVFLDSTKYSAATLFSLTESRSLVIKWPYLNRSYRTDRNVSSIIAEALPGTAVLAIFAILLALIIGVTLGVLAAVKKGSVFDNFSIFLSVFGMSAPSFFVAIIVAWIGGFLWFEQTTIPAFPIFTLLLGMLLAIANNRMTGRRKLSVGKWGLGGLLTGLLIWVIQLSFGVSIPVVDMVVNLPGTGLSMTGSLYAVDVWEGRYLEPRNLILPVLTLGIRPLAVIVQLTRSSLLDELEKDYIRTARAKGLSEVRVVVRHGLRNALNPVVTAVSGWFASLLAGAVFVEFVFGYKGLGLQVFTALEKDDLPVVMGAVLVIAATFVVINILVDFVYGWLDPRVRVGAS